jgi:DNA polymerase zeta
MVRRWRLTGHFLILYYPFPCASLLTRHPWGGGSCVGHYVRRARLNLRLLEHLDLVKRTAEMARIFGISFFDVILRGSQYRVESMLLRLAHTQNYLMVSPR